MRVGEEEQACSLGPHALQPVNQLLRCTVDVCLWLLFEHREEEPTTRPKLCSIKVKVEPILHVLQHVLISACEPMPRDTIVLALLLLPFEVPRGPGRQEPRV